MESLQSRVSKVSGRFPANLAVRLDNAPLCTFTFDDCPRSALGNAGRMLEERGVAGTFFVAGSFLDKSTDAHVQMVTTDDLDTLVRDGHELACHTYSHRSLRKMSIENLRADLDRNREVLLGASGVESLATFAYPFGETSWSGKVEIARRFAAARGVHPGINGRIVDLAQLRAVGINEFSDEQVNALIRRCVKQRGWLIFYTHDVDAAPSKFGCTEQQFARVLDLVMRAHIEVLPMRSAVGRIMHRVGIYVR